MSVGAPIYRFDGFALDLARGSLFSADGEQIQLRAKTFSMLRLFVENAGCLLDNATISQAIWPDVTVSDEGIAQCVSDIRRTLGGSVRVALKTMRRRGYIFDMDVSTAYSAQPKEPDYSVDKPLIAVLPFADLNDEPDRVHFSDGVVDDIITELSRSRTLFVITPAADFAHGGRAADIRRVGRDLGVRYVLCGSIRRHTGRVRVTARLVEAATGCHIWAERYDHDTQGALFIQEDIARAIAIGIGPAIADAEMRWAIRQPSTSLGAREAYQQGLWYGMQLDRVAHAEARHRFERAIQLDPTLAAAHIGLSRNYALAGVQYLTIPMDEALRLSTAHAVKATELDPGDAEAHARLAGSLAYQGVLDSAEALSHKAIAMNPNCPLAHEVLAGVLICRRMMSEARQVTAEFERLSPRDANIAHAHGRVAMSYYLEGDYRCCIDTARRQLSVYPGYTQTWRWLSAALAQLGHAAEARTALNRAIEASPRELEVFVRNRGPWMCREDHEHMIDGLRKAGLPHASTK